MKMALQGIALAAFVSMFATALAAPQTLLLTLSVDIDLTNEVATEPFSTAQAKNDFELERGPNISLCGRRRVHGKSLGYRIIKSYL